MTTKTYLPAYLCSDSSDSSDRSDRSDSSDSSDNRAHAFAVPVSPGETLIVKYLSKY